MNKILLLISAILNIVIGIWGFTLEPIEAVSFMAIFFGISIIINSLLIIIFAIKSSSEGEIESYSKRALLFRGIFSIGIAVFLLIYPTQSLRIIIVTLAIFALIDAITHLINPSDKIEMIISIIVIIFSLFLLISATFDVIAFSIIFYLLMAIITISGIKSAFIVLSGRSNLV